MGVYVVSEPSAFLRSAASRVGLSQHGECALDSAVTLGVGQTPDGNLLAAVVFWASGGAHYLLPV